MRGAVRRLRRLEGTRLPISYTAGCEQDEEEAGCFPPGHRRWFYRGSPRHPVAKCAEVVAPRDTLVIRGEPTPLGVWLTQPGFCFSTYYALMLHEQTDEQRRSVSPNYV